MRKLVKGIAFTLACMATLSFASCGATVFDFEMKSETVTGEKVANEKAFDEAFSQANVLAEAEGLWYAMEMQTREVDIVIEDVWETNKSTMGYYTEAVLEGKSKGKLSFSYDIYEHDGKAMKMVNTGMQYRVKEGNKVVEITPQEDGSYTGTVIGTDMLQDALSVGWTLFGVSDDFGEEMEPLVFSYEDFTYSAEETCYSMTIEQNGSKSTTKIWIVDGVVRKFRAEESVRASIGSSFGISEVCIEIYIGGMNGKVEIPDYQMDTAI